MTARAPGIVDTLRAALAAMETAGLADDAILHGMALVVQAVRIARANPGQPVHVSADDMRAVRH